MLCPIRLSRQDLWRSLTDEVENFTQKLRQAYAQIARGKDVVLMQGLGDLGADKVSTLACYMIAEALDAKVIVVLRYSSILNPSEIERIGNKLEQRLGGVIINFVPEAKMEAVKQDLTVLFKEVGVKVLGVLPEVRSLLGLSVKELAEVLGGEILVCQDYVDGIIENVMLGAMTPDSGVDYFSRKSNKAAVIRGERADMQLAALETSTKCLILTDNLKPLPAVLCEAEDKHVPIMVVKQDASGIIAGIEEALTKASFHSPQKLQKFENILGSYFDFKTFYSELGVES